MIYALKQRKNLKQQRTQNIIYPLQLIYLIVILLQQHLIKSGDDISYVWTDEGWMYLAVVIDLYSRAVIGWSIQPTMSRQLVCDALRMALWRRGFPRNVLFHSDRGPQYCSNDYQKLLKSFGYICSMGRKGNCWANAVAESFFSQFKNRINLHRTICNKRNCKTKHFSVYRRYYNRVRRHSAIGSIAPEVFENNLEMSHRCVYKIGARSSFKEGFNAFEGKLTSDGLSPPKEHYVK